MEAITMTIKVGQKLFCNGYPMTVKEICIGTLSGMAVVGTNRGSCCISISDLERFKDFDISKETYEEFAARKDVPQTSQAADAEASGFPIY